MSDAATAAVQHNIRLLCLKRPTVECSEAHRFVDAVATDVAAIAEALELRDPAILGWSGGAPYALAAASRLAPQIAAIHLVSPVPGALTGPNAVPGQTERLRQVAQTTASSSWISGPAALRDYQAVTLPWTFDLASVTRAVTLWSPSADEIVPSRLVEYLRNKLPNANTISVEGDHNWLTEGWGTVLSRLR